MPFVITGKLICVHIYKFRTTGLVLFIVAVSLVGDIAKRVLPNKSKGRGKFAACKARRAVFRHPVVLLYGIWCRAREQQQQIPDYDLRE